MNLQMTHAHAVFMMSDAQYGLYALRGLGRVVMVISKCKYTGFLSACV